MKVFYCKIALRERFWDACEKNFKIMVKITKKIVTIRSNYGIIFLIVHGALIVRSMTAVLLCSYALKYLAGKRIVPAGTERVE